jgi:hypothetical protein
MLTLLKHGPLVSITVAKNAVHFEIPNLFFRSPVGEEFFTTEENVESASSSLLKQKRPTNPSFFAENSPPLAADNVFSTSQHDPQLILR